MDPPSDAKSMGRFSSSGCVLTALFPRSAFVRFLNMRPKLVPRLRPDGHTKCAELFSLYLVEIFGLEWDVDGGKPQRAGARMECQHPGIGLTR